MKSEVSSKYLIVKWAKSVEVEQLVSSKNWESQATQMLTAYPCDRASLSWPSHSIDSDCLFYMA